ncbi:MAG: diacylglycerol kinase family protein [Mycobacteriales bacterium]
MDSLLLASGTAGSAAHRSVEVVRAALTADGAVEVATTSSPAELDVALAGRGHRRLILAGGDGSLHLLVDRLRRRGELADVPVGLVPMGTGNDFARHLGLPLDPEQAAEVLLTGHPRRLDLIRSDGGGGLAVNAAHLGKGAEAARRASGLKSRLGKLAYPLGAIASIVRPRGWRLHVNVDDEVLADGRHRVLMVAIGNGSSIGGGAPIFPHADASDGTLDVLVVSRFGALRRASGRAVTVTPAPGVTVGLNVDGELGELNRRRAWWVEPGAWSAIVPNR